MDSEYPGTAVARMLAARERARSLSPVDLNGEWPVVRRRILWAAGLRDLTAVPPGAGYTGHSFNDDNHCDATCMLDDVSHNLNDGPERVTAIAVGNKLGPGIIAASDPHLGPGGANRCRPAVNASNAWRRCLPESGSGFCPSPTPTLALFRLLVHVH